LTEVRVLIQKRMHVRYPGEKGGAALPGSHVSTATKVFWWLHLRLYSWTGGRIGGKVLGLTAFLLTTRGRKTGQSRTTAITYIKKGESFVLIASYAGESRHPAWYLNLEKTPEAEIQIGRRRVPVVARIASGDERTALWDEAVATYPDYAVYKERTDRQIPVVVLDPR